MQYNFIKVNKEGFIFHLTLARPEKRNAFTPTMVNEILHAFEDANADETIKIVIIRADGPVFCAGMDLKTFADSNLDKANEAIENRDISLGEVFDKLVKPSLAILEGDVIAGAFLIVLGCTYVYAQEAVKFKLPELDLGIFPFQVMASLLKVMPEKKVLQLCLDTRAFDMNKAIELGIVDGYYDSEKIKSLVAGFEHTDVNALKLGIASLRELPNMNRKNQYAYLKGQLEQLRNKE